MLRWVCRWGIMQSGRYRKLHASQCLRSRVVVSPPRASIKNILNPISFKSRCALLFLS